MAISLLAKTLVPKKILKRFAKEILVEQITHRLGAYGE